MKLVFNWKMDVVGFLLAVYLQESNSLKLDFLTNLELEVSSLKFIPALSCDSHL